MKKKSPKVAAIGGGGRLGYGDSAILVDWLLVASYWLLVIGLTTPAFGHFSLGRRGLVVCHFAIFLIYDGFLISFGCAVGLRMRFR